MKTITIQLELSPEIEAQLTEKARARGVGLSDYVQSVLEEAIATESAPRRRTEEEMQAFFDAMAVNSEKIPQLPDQAFTRESFYLDHD